MNNINIAEKHGKRCWRKWGKIHTFGERETIELLPKKLQEQQVSLVYRLGKK